MKSTVWKIMSLKKEDSSVIETAIEAVVDFVARPFAILKPNATHPSLNEIREKNKFGFWAPTIGAVLSAIGIAFVLLLVTTDDFDGQYLSHTHLSNFTIDIAAGQIDSEARTKTFIFYIRDASIVLLLLLYSFIFFSVTSKYLKVFNPKISERCNNFLWKARFLVHAPQFIAVFVLMTGGTTLSLFGVYATVLVFLYAAFFPKVLEKRLRNLIVDIIEKIPDDAPFSRQRLTYIHKHKVLGFVYRGWAALNFLLAVFVLAYSFIPSYFLPNIPAGNDEVALAIFASAAIVICAVVFSTVGAARSYSRETDMRYFNAVDILNREFNWFSSGSGGPGQDEARLKEAHFYSLEDDPTIDVQKNEMRSAGSLLELARVFRAVASALFAVLMGVATGSLEFGVAAFAALAFSFGFNDLSDFRSGKDHICHPDRPLPSGAVSQATVIVVLSGLVIILAVSAMHLGVTAAAPVILFFGGIAYSGWLKTLLPVFATPFWCALLAGVIAAAMELTFMEAIAVWLLVLAREIVFDIRDRDADYAFSGRRNIAYSLTSRPWSFISGMIGLSVFILYISKSDISYFYVLVVGLVLVQMARHLFALEKSSDAARVFSIVSHALWPLAFYNVI